MQDLEVFQNVTTINTDISIYPLDDDILSLEISNCYSYNDLSISLSYRDIYLQNDLTSLQVLANSILVLQQLYGVIPNISAIGPHSQAIVDMILQYRLEGKLQEVDLPPEIDRLILIDRSVDMVTPLITPLTYEGVIDEVSFLFNSLSS